MRALRGLGLSIAGLVSLLMIFAGSGASASSANLSHSYQATSTIPNGSIVSLNPQHTNYVQLANTSNGSRLIGVALASQDSLLAVDSGSAPVQVALNGSVATLVSDLNGNIKVGDQVGVSPFSGIGTASTPGAHVVGVAQTAFDAASPSATTESVRDTSGKLRQVQVGYIQLSIAIGTAGNGGVGGGNQLNFLQKLIKSLSGHTISTIRIVLSLIVTVISLVSLVTLIYASVYGSIISIGRNPLAQHAVFKTLTSVMVMAMLTIGVACVTVFYLLH